MSPISLELDQKAISLVTLLKRTHVGKHVVGTEACPICKGMLWWEIQKNSRIDLACKTPGCVVWKEGGYD